ncbi:hypothetical protein HZA73_07150 [candidate division TA06 bacterium]|nr:hypothetical protein [candidate division TA06 bacterium]
MKYEAYWISPRGRIIPVTGQVVTHIRAVIKNPARFGLSREAILEAYKRHREPLGLEGKARQEIMAGLLRKGWIRLRYVPRGQYFTVQARTMARPRLLHLRAWAQKVTDGQIDQLDAQGYHLRIVTQQTDEAWTGSIKDFLKKST